MVEFCGIFLFFVSLYVSDLPNVTKYSYEYEYKLGVDRVVRGGTVRVVGHDARRTWARASWRGTTNVLTYFSYH